MIILTLSLDEAECLNDVLRTEVLKPEKYSTDELKLLDNIKEYLEDKFMEIKENE